MLLGTVPRMPPILLWIFAIIGMAVCAVVVLLVLVGLGLAGYMAILHWRTKGR